MFVLLIPMTLAQEIAALLLKIKAVTLRTDPPFTWVSGLKMPIYCDNRLLVSYPEAFKKVVAGFKKTVGENNLQFDVIAGTATAGIPWAAFLAYELDKPMVYVRPEPKAHGTGKQVEGIMPRGSKVLIVEDLISTGGSSLKSAAACQKEYGADVVGILAIFNYEMAKSKQAFADADLPLYALTNFLTLLETAGAEGYITPEQKQQISSWSADPEHWWENFSGAQK